MRIVTLNHEPGTHTKPRIALSIQLKDLLKGAGGRFSLGAQEIARRRERHRKEEFGGFVKSSHLIQGKLVFPKCRYIIAGQESMSNRTVANEAQETPYPHVCCHSNGIASG